MLISCFNFQPLLISNLEAEKTKIGRQYAFLIIALDLTSHCTGKICLGFTKRIFDIRNVFSFCKEIAYQIFYYIDNVFLSHQNCILYCTFLHCIFTAFLLILHFSKAIAFAFGDRNTVKLNSLGVKLLILRIAVDFLSCRFILLRNTSKIRKV